jgi:hypothetical protein
MLAFQFRVNASFLTYSSHPITIPKSQIDYRSLGVQLASVRWVEVSAPDGRVLAAAIYSGTAGYGPYYQIRCQGYPGDAMCDIQKGTLLNVELHPSMRGTVVRLTSA